MAPRSEKPQLHISGMQMLSKCGIQFEFRYLKGIKRPPSIAMARGSAVDEAVTKDLGHKISTGVLLSEEAVLAIARDKADALLRDVELTPDERVEGAERVKGRTIDRVVSLSKLYHREVAPGVAPTHVQRQWVLDIRGMAFELAGAIDVQEGLRAVRDTKTSSKSPSKQTAEESTQLTAYALATRQLDGAAPERLVLDYLVSLKSGDKLVQLETKSQEGDFQPFLMRAAAAWEVIQKGAFMPAKEDDWWCSERWCGYWNMCPFVRRPVSVAIGEVNR